MTFRYIEHSLYLMCFLQILGQHSLLPISARHINNVLIQIFDYFVLCSEGIRITQVPCFLTSNIVALIAITNRTDYSWLITFNCIGLFLSIVLRLYYGAGDFSKVKIRGPYAVGFREHFVESSDTAVSVFYPIDAKYKNEKPASKHYFMNYGDK